MVVDGVKVYIWFQQFELMQVVIMQCVNVVLLYLVVMCIFGIKEYQYCSFELCYFVFVQGFVSQMVCQNVVQFCFVCFSKYYYIQCVVRYFIVVSGEVIQMFGQGSLQVSKVVNVGIGNFVQFCYVVVKGCLFDVEGFVWMLVWQYFDGERVVFGDFCVMFQRIDWVIGGVDYFYVYLLYDVVCGEVILRQQFVIFVLDFIGS